MIETARVNKDQNLVDMALQEYGSVEGLVKMCLRNSLTLFNDPAVGTMLQVESAEVVNTGVRTFYKNRKHRVCSSSDYIVQGELLTEEGDGLLLETGDDIRLE